MLIKIRRIVRTQHVNLSARLTRLISRYLTKNKNHPLLPVITKSSNKPPVYRKAVMFAFAARAGSTAITHAIAKMGLARRIDEIFNPRGPAQNLQQIFGGDSIRDYINNIHDKAMLTDCFIFKTNYMDLSVILDNFDIHALFLKVALPLVASTLASWKRYWTFKKK